MFKTGTIGEKADFKSAGHGQRRRRRRWFLYLGIGATNLAFSGLVAGLFFGLYGDPQPADQHEPVMLDLRQSILRGEELQRNGHPERAIELYQQASLEDGAAATSLSYRMGVCAEQLGQSEYAARLYESTLHHEHEGIAAAARLALAKLHYEEGNFEASLKLLSALALVASRPVLSATQLGPEVDYVFALVQTARVLTPQLSGPLDIDHFFAAEIQFDLDDALRMVPHEGQLGQQQVGDLGDVDFGVRIHGESQHPATTLVSARLSNQPLSVAVEQLTGAANWPVIPTEVAREILAAKVVDIHLQDKTAGELLTLLLEPQRLFWTFENGTLRIDTRDQVSEEDITAFNRLRSAVLLQGALAASPDHILAPQAYLALGNLAGIEERWERAATLYRETTERFPRLAAAQIAHFNLAKSAYRTHDMEQAKQEFYAVVDLRRGTEMEPLAYIYLGRIYFDQGDLQRAKKELSRGLALATKPEYAAAGAMTLAAVYLIEDHTGAADTANAILFDHRSSLHAAAFRHEAVFLSALTRYRNALRQEDQRRRGQELLAAVVRVDPSRFFGDFGYLLVGDAFAELSLSEDAVRWYLEGLAHELVEPMTHRLMFRLANEYRRQHEMELAENLLRQLAKSPSPTWSPQASIELAEVLFQAMDFQECIAHCRWALEQGYQEVETMALLRQLGRVYEELGDYELAGFCFAGFLPSRPPIVAEVRR